MNNEETKVFDQSEETVLMNDTTEKTEGAEATQEVKKDSGVGAKVAFAAGGFVAGLAAGVAGSAFAADSSDEDIIDVVTKDDTEGVPVAQVDDEATFAEAFADARAQVGPGGVFEWRGNVYNTYYEEEWDKMSAEERAEFQSKVDYEEIAGTEVVEEQPVTPATEEVLIATDEGVRIAQVDDEDSFAKAFADARAQVGPGGAFEWRGNVYNTYYEEEWNNMSASERAEYQSKIDYESIAGDTTGQAAAGQTQTVMASDTQMVDTTEVDGEIKVLGVEAVVTEDGDQMIMAGIEVDGEQALLVDVDCDGTMDCLVVDADYDGMIDADEVIDVSEANIEVGDLMQIQGNDDMYLASNDGMPDYMNDADVSAMA